MMARTRTCAVYLLIVSTPVLFCFGLFGKAYASRRILAREVPARLRPLYMAPIEDANAEESTVLSRVLDAARNAGLVKQMADWSAVATGLRKAVGKPEMIGEYLRPQDVLLDVQYGNATEQRLDVIYRAGRQTTHRRPRPVLLFFHGGAWGSGSKLFYRSFARRLSDALQCTVVVCGYPTYPLATAWGQASSVALATRWARSREGRDALGDREVQAGVIVCGHSSGGHIASLSTLWAAEDVARAEIQTEGQLITKHLIHASPDSRELFSVLPDAFVGIAGVYDIRTHYVYEESRGVADISPMKPACGGSPLLFDELSPRQELRRMSAEGVKRVPPMLLLHGDQDVVVPSTSSHSMNVALSLARNRAGQDGRLDAYVLFDEISHADVITEIAYMENETPTADRIFPAIRKFVDALVLPQTGKASSEYVDRHQ